MEWGRLRFLEIFLYVACTIGCSEEKCPSCPSGEPGDFDHFESQVTDAQNPRVLIRLSVPATADISVYVEKGGKRIRTIREGPAAAGRHTWEWDLTNDEGNRVTKGEYVICLAIEGQGVDWRECCRAKIHN